MNYILKFQIYSAAALEVMQTRCEFAEQREMGETTLRGKLAKTLGISRKEAGLANRALVEEGFAERLSVGVYRIL